MPLLRHVPLFCHIPLFSHIPLFRHIPIFNNNYNNTLYIIYTFIYHYIIIIYKQTLDLLQTGIL